MHDLKKNVTLVNGLIVQCSASPSQGENKFTYLSRQKYFPLSAVQKSLRYTVALFYIRSPLSLKRLISHSAGLWRLTRTNSASCWLVTHTGTARDWLFRTGKGSTPLIVRLAYFLSFTWMPHCLPQRACLRETHQKNPPHAPSCPFHPPLLSSFSSMPSSALPPRRRSHRMSPRQTSAS